MDDQLLFNMNSPRQHQVDGVAVVSPNVWLMSSEDIPPLLFDADEVARLLSVGRHRVYDLIREGRLRSIKVGRCRRVSARALADFVSGLELEAT